jgi:hypothetical protein
MNRPRGELQEMGKRGTGYVQRYDWPTIAAKHKELYEWVLGRGPQPDFVER